MTVQDFNTFISSILYVVNSFWNLLGTFTIAGIPFTTWLLSLVALSFILSAARQFVGFSPGLGVSGLKQRDNHDSKNKSENSSDKK